MKRISIARIAGFAAVAIALPQAVHAQPFPHAGHMAHAMPMQRPVPPPRSMAVPRAPDRHPGHEAQNEARREMRAGNVQSLRQIERHVVPTMPGMQYLGPEYDPDVREYRLKFIRDGRVVFVDVDARTGQVLSQTR